MKLTNRSEYALLAMTELARRQGEGRVSAGALARGQGVPLKFLEQILLSLRRGGLVRSGRGRAGGHELARDPAKITLAEIVRLMDGALAPTESVSRFFYHATPIEREAGLVRVFREVRDLVARKLESTTLAEVCRENGAAPREKKGR
jgi:Rrf2 family transcriptional regulator, cysteine metabolism repressor